MSAIDSARHKFCGRRGDAATARPLLRSRSQRQRLQLFAADTATPTFIVRGLPVERIKTHSLPTLARCYPRSFTFYLGNPFETRSRARSLAATRRGFTFYFEIPSSSIPRLTANVARNRRVAAKSTKAALICQRRLHAIVTEG